MQHFQLSENMDRQLVPALLNLAPIGSMMEQLQTQFRLNIINYIYGICQAESNNVMASYLLSCL